MEEKQTKITMAAKRTMCGSCTMTWTMRRTTLPHQTEHCGALTRKFKPLSVSALFCHRCPSPLPGRVLEFPCISPLGHSTYDQVGHDVPSTFPSLAIGHGSVCHVN